MLRVAGVCLILLGAGGFGIQRAAAFFRQLIQLREFSAMLELLSCELNYTLLPAGELCRQTSTRATGTAARFLAAYAGALEQDRLPPAAAREALNQTRGLLLPNDASLALLELFGALGRYDLDGENRLLALTQQRIRQALQRCETEKRPLARGYAALGLCTGAALAILLL